MMDKVGHASWLADILMRGRAANSFVAFLAIVWTMGATCDEATAQQLVNDPLIMSNFAGISEIGAGIGNVAQMTFGPDGRLYVATWTNGVKRYDYNPAGNLTNEKLVWSRPSSGSQLNGSLGVAFHEDPTLGTVMYLAPAVTSSFNVEVNITQSIIRLTDNDGDGNWGEAGAGEVNQAIVDNLRVTDLHQVNQLLVRDDTLYAGIGSRTRTGGQISEYGGAPNPDDGEFAYTGSINWIRDLTQLSGDTTTANVSGFNIMQHHTDVRPLTSADTGKLTVYSTGFRNVFGMAFDGEGQLWASMNQNEGSFQKPDELHRSDFQDDHQFPKRNEISGDWKANAAAVAAGYFQNFEDPVALLGNNASANGFDFTNRNDAFAGHAFIVRFSNGDDLLAVDPDTGNWRQVVTGLSNPLDVLTDPQGNLLVGQFGGGGKIFRLELFPGSNIFGDLNRSGMVDSADWMILRDNFNSDLTGLTPTEAMARGDLNGDFHNDRFDFALFKTAYNEANGSSAFSQLLNVPEPPAAIQLAAIVAAALLLAGARKSNVNSYVRARAFADAGRQRAFTIRLTTIPRIRIES
jgi:glucose/arabinose dehydrogenase